MSSDSAARHAPGPARKRKRSARPPIAHPVEAFRREGDTILIEINIRQIAQLFNSLDPSPFQERELDDEADRYIFTAAREIGADKPFKLVIHLSGEATNEPGAAAIEAAIRSHFLYRLQTARRDLRHELRRGRMSLAIGLAFLIVCMAARELAPALWPSALQRILSEGLLIIGWVAMWGPLEIFLYGWWPIAGTCRILERLAGLDVDLRAREEGTPPASRHAYGPR
jgi:hypothetical protein